MNQRRKACEDGYESFGGKLYRKLNKSLDKSHMKVNESMVY